MKQLRQSFETALALHRAGLDFVLAPVPATDGAVLHHLSSRYALSVFPLLAALLVHREGDEVTCQLCLRVVDGLNAAARSAPERDR
jgi:Ser/Thr protein kinase RdoA (MazF antagonist)